MNEQLVPYTRFENEHEITELAQQLQTLARDNQASLRARNIGGPVLRYTGEITETTSSIRSVQESEDAEYHAILSGAGDVVGEASLHYGLGLQRLYVPLPPAFTPRVVKPFYACATPNITAWIDEGQSDTLLSNGYKHLVEKHREAKMIKRDRQNESAWTIEPNKSPVSVHEAIVMSGLRYVGSRRFHDQSAPRHIPPRSTLYADISYRWLKSSDIEKQLRCGERRDWYNRLSDKRVIKYMS